MPVKAHRHLKTTRRVLPSAWFSDDVFQSIPMHTMHKNALEHIPAYAAMGTPGLRSREERFPQVLENRFLGHAHEAGGQIEAQTRRHNQHTHGPEIHPANAPYTQRPRDSTVPGKWNSRENSRNNDFSKKDHLLHMQFWS